jgi:lipoate-protein ligase A
MLGRRWRLIDTGRLDGATNMAIDEALLEGFDPGKSPPVLRLYGWRPPALSLGRFQDAAAVLDLERCRSCSVPVIRRITGGGVIYHADELTYAVVCTPSDIPGESSVKQSFRQLNRFLLDFYRGLGLSVGFAVDAGGPPGRLGMRTPFCFAGRESYDILACGRKIGGNAQRRTRGAVFQHGSIPLEDRIDRGVRFLLERPPAPALRAASLRGLGVALSEAELKERLVRAFAAALGATMVPSDLTASERERAGSLAPASFADAGPV